MPVVLFFDDYMTILICNSIMHTFCQIMVWEACKSRDLKHRCTCGKVKQTVLYSLAYFCINSIYVPYLIAVYFESE